MNEQQSTLTANQVRLDEIKARLAKATPGKWEWEPFHPEYYTDLYNGLVAWNDKHTAGTYLISADIEHGEPVEAKEHDAALIAHAPADLRFLLDLVDQLHAALHYQTRVNQSRADQIAASLRHFQVNVLRASVVTYTALPEMHRQAADDLVQIGCMEHDQDMLRITATGRSVLALYESRVPRP